MYFCNLGKEKGNELVIATKQTYYDYRAPLSTIMRGQFCFSKGPKKVATVNQLTLKDTDKNERSRFVYALESFICELSDKIALGEGEYLNLLVRSKGTDDEHEFYFIKTRGDKRDEQNFRGFVRDFFEFKTKGIDEIMFAKNLNVVFEDRS